MTASSRRRVLRKGKIKAGGLLGGGADDPALVLADTRVGRLGMIELVREVRDHAFAAATVLKKTVEIEGVRLSLADVSPRMRFVMCRGYEKQDAELAAEILTPEDSVLEAGSAIGFLALFCIKRLGIRRYRMVEANPQMEPAIRRNFTLNGRSPPEITIAAVAAQDGEASFGVNRNFWSSSTVVRAGETRITVPARSLPSLVAEMGYQPTTLIMDIEGGEASIPHEHFNPFCKVVIETHRKLVGEGPIDRLLAALKADGFRQVGERGGSLAFTRS